MTDLLDDEALLDLRRRAKATDPAAVLAEERQRRAAFAARSNGLAVPAPASSPSASPASAPGLCAVCGTRPAKDKCTSCGRPACAADLWIMLRLCRACASDGDVERGQRGAKPEAGNWLEGRR